MNGTSTSGCSIDSIKEFIIKNASMPELKDLANTVYSAKEQKREKNSRVRMVEAEDEDDMLGGKKSNQKNKTRRVRTTHRRKKINRKYSKRRR